MNRAEIRRALLLSVFASMAALPASRAVADTRGERRGKAVQPLFGLTAPAEGPFPSDRFTVADATQNTCERIDLRTDWGRDQAQDCSAPSQEFPNDCVEVGILNQLDGFNIRPRFAVPFSGDLDLSTVHSGSVYLVKLGSSLVGNPAAPACMSARNRDAEDDDLRPAADAGWVVGIDRGVWDPDKKTLHFEAAEPLEQHTQYVLFVTRKVMDVTGNPIEASKAFKRAIGEEEDEARAVLDPRERAYRANLRAAVAQARFFGLRHHDIAAATVFTTMSVTSVLQKIRAQIASAPVTPANFNIATVIDPATHLPTTVRAVVALDDVAALTYNRQTFSDTSRPLSSVDLTTAATPRLTTLRSVRNGQNTPAVARIAVGNYPSPSYLWNRVLPFVGTYSGTPRVRASENAAMVVFIPRGVTPADGWPVIIIAHGSGDNLLGNAAFNVAGEYALKGFATVSINNVGAGFGANSMLTVTRTNAPPMTIPVPGRGDDVRQVGQPGPDGIIGAGEGAQQGPPAGIYLASNAVKQSIVNFMQLVRVLKAGVDMDGDGTNTLDGSHVYYNGVSAGAYSGVALFALEPDLRGAAFTGLGSWPAPWNSIEAGSRSAVGTYLQNHLPPLINPPGTPGMTCVNPDGTMGITCPGAFIKLDAPFFDDNLPAPGGPVTEHPVPGAVAIQDQWDRFEWISNTNAPGAFARYLRLEPLPGMPPRRFIISVAVGDQNVPNPQTAELIHAGLLADRVTLYRHDLFANKLSFKNPHTFQIRSEEKINGNPNVMREIALLAQAQVADFFQSDGVIAPDPDLSGALFETPASFIPITANFIP